MNNENIYSILQSAGKELEESQLVRKCIDLAINHGQNEDNPGSAVSKRKYTKDELTISHRSSQKGEHLEVHENGKKVFYANSLEVTPSDETKMSGIIAGNYYVGSYTKGNWEEKIQDQHSSNVEGTITTLKERYPDLVFE